MKKQYLKLFVMKSNIKDIVDKYFHQWKSINIFEKEKLKSKVNYGIIDPR